jgi:hypothetical membrane protein
MKRMTTQFHWFGIAGSVITIIAVIITAVTFRNSQGEAYSMLNRFISELGWVGVSSNAWLFNTAMIITGFFFIPFCLGLGLRIPNAWGKAGMATGVIAAIFCSLVGVFPMNHLPPHSFAAMWFFRSGLATVLLFGIAILAQRKGNVRVPKIASVFSLLAAIAYGAFLILATVRGAGNVSSATLSSLDTPPSFRILAVVEWCVFFSTILWFLGTALLARTCSSGRLE